MSTRVCSLEDLADGKPHRFEVDGTSLCLAAVDGEVFAIHDVCTHAEVSLSEGTLDGTVIECFLHGATFDLRTGAATLPAIEPVATFPVSVEGNDVLVTLER
jgi:3-phenylpropionate/trans-cinnamate dioxygenase ferredoxin component